MTIKCDLIMLTFTKTKNARLPDSVHNAGVALQSRDIPHTLPSPIIYDRAPGVPFLELVDLIRLTTMLSLIFLRLHSWNLDCRRHWPVFYGERVLGHLYFCIQF
jgi:hypothetical protein